MVEITVNIEDEHFDIGKFVSQFASHSNVTINIFTREEDLEKSEVLLVEEDAVKITDTSATLSDEEIRSTLFAKLATLKGDNQTAYAEELKSSYKDISWKMLGDVVGIRGDTLYRRCKVLREKGKRKQKKPKKAAKKKAKPKAKPKPKLPSTPKLSEYDVVEAVYGTIQGKPDGVHFAKTISSQLIHSYSKRYAADAKLDEFTTTINSRIDDAMNKIALALGPTKCMVTRSQESNGQFSTQLMVYNKDIPNLDILWDKLVSIGVVK